MKIVASIQARMGSSRLPGKVLKDICGKPMLLWHLERIKRSRLLDDVIIATTTSEKDDELISFCNQHSVSYFRGSENDVLKRVSALINHHEIDIHIELCGDSPLTDPQIIDEFVGYYLKYHDRFDYVSNSIKTTYPPGQEVMVYPGSVLASIDESISFDDPMREHVGYNITRFPEYYRLASLEAPDRFFEPEAYLEVDTPIDLEMMRKLIGCFVEKGLEHFSLSQILELLRQKPEIMQQNRFEERRWKSLREDSDA